MHRNARLTRSVHETDYQAAWSFQWTLQSGPSRRASVLIEPRDRPGPCLRRRLLVVTFRGGVIEETVNRIGPDVTLVGDVVLLQFRLVRRIGLHEPRVERPMMHEDRGFDLLNLFR